MLFKVKGPVALITLNRPAQLNAINSGIRSVLTHAWKWFEQDEAPKVAILTGSSEKVICAGMDLKQAATSRLLKTPPRDFFPVLGDNVHASTPIIAAVNGVAYAGGWLFAHMCGICVASDNASFGITEAKVGRGMAWATPLIHMPPSAS